MNYLFRLYRRIAARLIALTSKWRAISADVDFEPRDMLIECDKRSGALRRSKLNV